MLFPAPEARLLRVGVDLVTVVEVVPGELGEDVGAGGAVLVTEAGALGFDVPAPGGSSGCGIEGEPVRGVTLGVGVVVFAVLD